MKARRKAIQEARNRLDEAYIHDSLPQKPVVGKTIHPDDIRSGDIVYIESLAQEGTVLSVQGKELTVQVGGLRTIVKMSACTFVTRKKTKKNTKVHVGTSIAQKTSEIRPEIDVRGMTVLEAEAVLGKFIDDAVFTGLSKILVIHGKGTGALRQGLQDYLKQHRSVLRFSFADISEGGTGASVVELR